MSDAIRAWFQRCKSILSLGEYEIELALDPGLEDLGRCYSDPTYNAALIELRDPAGGNHADWARSLLHELVHVRMGGSLGTEEGSAERSALERGVEMMTRILYRMITGGASDAAVSRVAAGCARSIKTAREGNATRRSPMGNGARIAEIAMSLGGMELPDEAKALVTELIGLASGDENGGGVEPDSVVGKDEPMPDGIDPAKMPPAYREQVKRIAADLAFTERATIMNRAALEVPADVLTVAIKAEISKLPPAEARAFISGLKRGAAARPSPKSATETRREALKPGADVEVDDDSKYLRPGEKLDKVNPGLIAVRRQIAASLPRGGRH